MEHDLNSRLCTDERLDPEEGTVNLLVDLHSYPHLWSQAEQLNRGIIYWIQAAGLVRKDSARSSVIQERHCRGPAPPHQAGFVWALGQGVFW